jgi:hypothetical protein
VLDDVQRRALLVQPAREDPRPARVGPLDIDLDEGAGQLLGLPRRGGLAGAQADDDVLEANRLARPQIHVADDAVALVEQAEDRDPLGHGRHPRLIGGRARNLDGDGIAFRGLVFAAPATSQRGKDGKACNRFVHAWSGVQAL